MYLTLSLDMLPIIKAILSVNLIIECVIIRQRVLLTVTFVKLGPICLWNLDVTNRVKTVMFVDGPKRLCLS